MLFRSQTTNVNMYIVLTAKLKVVKIKETLKKKKTANFSTST